jgi:hypothetical protein
MRSLATNFRNGRFNLFVGPPKNNRFLNVLPLFTSGF